MLDCYRYDGKSWLSRKITEIRQGSISNSSVIRQMGLCRSLHSFLLRNFSKYYWVTLQHCSVGWLPSTTRHPAQVKMHSKLKLTEHRPVLESKCQGVAAQPGQNHPAPLAPANSSHCPSAPSLSSPAPKKTQQKITSPQIQQRAVWEELCRKTTVVERIFINTMQDAENSFAPAVN